MKQQKITEFANPKSVHKEYLALKISRLLLKKPEGLRDPSSIAIKFSLPDYSTMPRKED